LFDVPLEVMVNDNDHAFVYMEDAGPLSKQRLRPEQIKSDMRGHVAELLAKSVQARQLDTQLTADDQMLLLDYLAHEGALDGKELAYKGRNGRGWAANPGAGLNPGTPSDPLGFRELLASGVGKVYSAVQEFPMHGTMFQPVGGMDQIAQGFAKRLGKKIRYGQEVQSIRQSPDKVTIALKDTSSGKLSSVSADYCLCTVPLSVLRTIDADFSDRFKGAIKAVSYAPVGKIGLQMKRRFWEEDDQIYGGHVLTDMKGINTISLPSVGLAKEEGRGAGLLPLRAGCDRSQRAEPVSAPSSRWRPVKKSSRPTANHSSRRSRWPGTASSTTWAAGPSGTRPAARAPTHCCSREKAGSCWLANT
jgi:monoamine oxidase